MEDMNINSVKAKVLTAALPYIQKYNGKTVVVKYGGNAMIHPLLKKAVMSDIILLKLVGINIVLVHGGGPEISSMLERLDIPSRFVNGLRYTDEETIEIVQMVLSGKTNKDLVSLIEQLGGTAIGMCGIDAGMIQSWRAITAMSAISPTSTQNPLKMPLRTAISPLSRPSARI